MSYRGVNATATEATDEELAVDAGRGDAGAFSCLFQRHVESAWQLALATAPSADDAARATVNGFVGVLRLVGRGRDDVADHFRTQVLAAVYRDAYAGADRATKMTRAFAPGAVAPLMVAAFANLPARWRAALWLQEVEGMPATEAGPILGVSSAAAVALRKRGLAGLEDRVTQAGGSLPLPDLLTTLTGTPTALAGTAMAMATAAVPPELAPQAMAKWKKVVARDRRVVPAAGWLTDRVPGPLAAGAVGLFAVGIIGLAVIGQGTTVNRLPPAGPVAAATPAAGVPGGGTFNLGNLGGFANPASTGGTGANAPTATQGSVSASSATTGTTTATTVAPVTVATTLPSTTQPTTTLPTVTIPPPVTTVPPVTTTVPPVTTPVTTPPANTPVVQVSVNAGIVAVNVGVGPGSCTGINLLGIKIGCTDSPPGVTLGGSLLGGK